MSEPILSPAQKRRFTKACGELNRLLKEVKKQHPTACMYLAGQLHIMSSSHHDDRTNSGLGEGEQARQDRIMHSATLDADGGDW